MLPKEKEDEDAAPNRAPDDEGVAVPNRDGVAAPKAGVLTDENDGDDVPNIEPLDAPKAGVAVPPKLIPDEDAAPNAGVLEAPPKEKAISKLNYNQR